MTDYNEMAAICVFTNVMWFVIKQLSDARWLRFNSQTNFTWAQEMRRLIDSHMEVLRAFRDASNDKGKSP